MTTSIVTVVVTPSTTPPAPHNATSSGSRPVGSTASSSIGSSVVVPPTVNVTSSTAPVYTPPTPTPSSIAPHNNATTSSVPAGPTGSTTTVIVVPVVNMTSSTVSIYTAPTPTPTTTAPLYNGTTSSVLSLEPTTSSRSTLTSVLVVNVTSSTISVAKHHHSYRDCTGFERSSRQPTDLELYGILQQRYNDDQQAGRTGQPFIVIHCALIVCLLCKLKRCGRYVHHVNISIAIRECHELSQRAYSASGDYKRNDLHCAHLRIDNYNDGAARQLHVLWQRSIELQHDMYLKHSFKLRSAGHFHVQVLGLCERYEHQRLHEPMFDCFSHDKLRQLYLAGFCTGGHDKLR
ncbi:hypothetical protein LTS02_007943 [Friedmanniomyces endolithicus]|nr:hypothetical protein LTS02_007943 [Friedmanniomyces endolithicus]